jgi:hypothetical protein
MLARQGIVKTAYFRWPKLQCLNVHSCIFEVYWQLVWRCRKMRALYRGFHGHFVQIKFQMCVGYQRSIWQIYWPCNALPAMCICLVGASQVLNGKRLAPFPLKSAVMKAKMSLTQDTRSFQVLESRVYNTRIHFHSNFVTLTQKRVFNWRTKYSTQPEIYASPLVNINQYALDSFRYHAPHMPTLHQFDQSLDFIRNQCYQTQ